MLSGREACRILAEHGFVEVRRKGSHVIMQKTKADDSITIPVPDHRTLRIGTLMFIVGQSGLPRSVFEQAGAS